MVPGRVEIVMMHGSLEMVSVESGHGGRGRSVLMMLYRNPGRRSGHQILEAEVRVASSASSEIEASSASTSLHAVERERRVAVANTYVPSLVSLHCC